MMDETTLQTVDHRISPASRPGPAPPSKRESWFTGPPVVGGTTPRSYKGTEARMSLADRLESLGWQRMHETTVDKRQEVSLDPVISPEHLRNVRQQHSRQAGSRPVTGSADTPNAYAAAGGFSRGSRRREAAPRRHVDIDPIVTRMVTQTTTTTHTTTTTTTTTGSRRQQSNRHYRSLGSPLPSIVTRHQQRQEKLGASATASNPGVGRSGDEEVMVGEMEVLYSALRKVEMRRRQVLNAKGVFDDEVNLVRARSQLRVSLKKSVNAAFDGIAVSDLGLVLGFENTAPATQLEAKLWQLQSQLETMPLPSRADGFDSSRVAGAKEDVTAESTSARDDHNRQLRASMREELLESVMRSDRLGALRDNEDCGSVAGSPGSNSKKSGRGNGNGVHPSRGNGAQSKGGGGAAEKTSSLSEMMSTARETAMRFEEVQIQPELAELRAETIELATELNLNRYQEAIEERRNKLLMESGMDPTADVESDLFEGQGGTESGAGVLRRSMYLRHGSSVLGISEEKAAVRRLAYMRNLDHKGLVEAAKKKIASQTDALVGYERLAKERLEREKEADHGGAAQKDAPSSADAVAGSVDGAAGADSVTDNDVDLDDPDDDGEHEALDEDFELGNRANEEDSEDDEEGGDAYHSEPKSKADADAEERAMLQRRRSSLAVTPLGMRRKLDAQKQQVSVAGEKGPRPGDASGIGQAGNIDGDGLLMNDPIERELRKNLQHSPSTFVVPPLPNMDFENIDEPIGEGERVQRRLYRVWDMLGLSTLERVEYLVQYATADSGQLDSVGVDLGLGDIDSSNAAAEEDRSTIEEVVHAWEVAVAAKIEFERLVEKRATAHEDAKRVMNRQSGGGGAGFAAVARRMSIAGRRMSVAGRRMSVSGAGMLALYTKKLSLAESYDAIIDTARSHLIGALDVLEHRASGIIMKDGVDYRVPLRAAVRASEADVEDAHDET